MVGDQTEDQPNNARVLAPDGTILARFRLGDGIKHVGIDGADRIWVGWSDYGVFANNDWGVPGQEWPPSSSGTGCFAAAGTFLPLREIPEAAGIVIDCYALNLVGDGARTCLYDEFPILYVHPGEPACWWRNDIIGSTALAVAGEHVLLAGGYGENLDRLVLIGLDDRANGGAVRPLATWRLPLIPRKPSPGEAPETATRRFW